jgi:hypothetical protein
MQPGVSMDDELTVVTPGAGARPSSSHHPAYAIGDPAESNAR